MTPRLDLTGQQFGRLTVIRFTEDRDNQGRVLWLCRCECGRSSNVSTLRLRSGNTKSCGCLKAEGQGRVTHGYARKGNRDPLYVSWHAMRRRCSNPKDKRWADYGGRGITVCAEWETSFEAFLRDVGPRPSPELSLDRIDNNRGYEPGNVRWATRVEQAANRRRPAPGIPRPGARLAACKRGHAFTDENTYVTPEGRRVCRECVRFRWRQHRDGLPI